MIRLAIANTADKPSVAIDALGRADYVMMNECRDRVIAWARRRAKLRGGPVPQVGMYASLQNVHVYRQDQVGVVARGTKVLLQGGKLGLGRSRKDRRRRGPTRTSPWQLIFERSSTRCCILIDPHLLARTTTTERWRWPLMLASLARLRGLAHTLQLRFPGVPIVCGGDGNLPKLGQWKLGKGWRVIDTPADFGRRHYTQLYVRGDVDVSAVAEWRNDSDHDGITCHLVIGPGAPTLGDIEA